MREQLGLTYVKVGFIWLLAGMVFGIWMGITENFQFSNAHAHTNLVGFVLSALFGLVMIALPALAASKLAVLQFVIYQIGAIVLVIGKVTVTLDPHDNAVVAIGSMIVLVGTLLFAWMLFSHRKT